MKHKLGDDIMKNYLIKDKMMRVIYQFDTFEQAEAKLDELMTRSNNSRTYYLVGECDE